MHQLHNLFSGVQPMPPEWRSMLQEIQIITRALPVLSGGALRDWCHGKPVKDLDIFLPCSNEDMLDLDQWFLMTGWQRTQNIPPSCEGLNEVTAVVGYSKLGCTEVNIIFLAHDVDLSPLGVASRNDFGICQISAWVVRGEWHFEFTEAFMQDSLEQTFTLLREGDEARSLRRYERLREKYPNHTLQTPLIPPSTPTYFN